MSRSFKLSWNKKVTKSNIMSRGHKQLLVMFLTSFQVNAFSIETYGANRKSVCV